MRNHCSSVHFKSAAGFSVDPLEPFRGHVVPKPHAALPQADVWRPFNVEASV